jgi:hypothetical protein
MDMSINKKKTSWSIWTIWKIKNSTNEWPFVAHNIFTPNDYY